MSLYFCKNCQTVTNTNQCKNCSRETDDIKNFVEMKQIDFGDGTIFIIPTSLDTPVKVVFESEISDNPTNEDLFDLINKVKPI